MPKILDRLVGQLEAKGKPKQQAYAIAVSALQKSGNLRPGTVEATSKGKARGEMGAAGRAKDRAAKESGKHSVREYTYSPKTNRATLKNKK